jgi:ribosomal protein L20A (L18A)
VGSFDCALNYLSRREAGYLELSRMAGITKLLEQAVDQARELPAEDQDAVAETLYAHIANRDRRYGLIIEQIEEVKRIRARLRSGETRLATDEEVAALWKKCGA